MVISSLVVDTMPDFTAQASDALIDIQGVEVHEVQGRKLVVTIEAETLDESHKIASSFQKIEEVATVNLVYANFEDDPSLENAGR